MTNKAADKIIDALTQLLEGYTELVDSIQADFEGSKEVDEDEVSAEIDAAITTEMRAAIESVLESEDISPEDFAGTLSSITEALEEIDPSVFEQEETESVADDDDIDYDDEDDDEDDDDDTDDDSDEEEESY